MAEENCHYFIIIYFMKNSTSHAWEIEMDTNLCPHHQPKHWASSVWFALHNGKVWWYITLLHIPSLPDFYQGIIQAQQRVKFLVWLDMCGCVFWKLKEFGALKYTTLCSTWRIYWWKSIYSIVYTLHTYNLLATHSALHCSVRGQDECVSNPSSSQQPVSNGGTKRKLLWAQIKR